MSQYHLTVSAIPVSNEILGFHPSDSTLELSITFLGVPSNPVVSNKISHLYPKTLAIIFAKSFIEISEPLPTFIRPSVPL